MEQGRLPRTAIFSSLHGNMKRKVGRPRITWEKCVSADLKVLGKDEGSWEASCQIKSAWRDRLWGLTHPWERPWVMRCGRLTKRAFKKDTECHVVLSAAGRSVIHHYLRGGRHLQPLSGVLLGPAASPHPFVKRDHCTALWAVQHPSMTPTGFVSVVC